MVAESGDGPVSRPEVRRNCGQLLGRLDAVLPFLYVAQVGLPARVLRSRFTTTRRGLFAVGKRGQRERNVAVIGGVILPLYLCRQERTRTALQETAGLLGALDPKTVMTRRDEIRSKLDEALGGALVMAEREKLDSWLVFEQNRRLFQLLHDEFEFVTEVLDDPRGAVRVVGSEAFPWHSHGELLEWYHETGDRGSQVWSPFVPFLVTADTAALPAYCSERWAHLGLVVPGEDPSRWFVIRPGVPDAAVSFRFEMDRYGWAFVHVALAESSLRICLSEVFDPFDELMAWGQRVEAGDIPVQMEIDEEGTVKVLTVLRTEDQERVLFRICTTHSSAIELEGIVSRAALTAALKAELRRFFETDFDPEHWDSLESDDEDYVPAKERVLGSAWLAATE